MRLLSRVSKGLIFSVTMSFLWACSLVNTRYMLIHGEDALNLAVWLGLFLIIPWVGMLIRHRREFAHLSVKLKWYLVGIGIASSIGLNLLQTLSLAHTPAVNFSFLYRTIVIFTIILAYIFFREKITVKKWVLAGLILFGSYLFTTRGKGMTLTAGDLYTLAYALSAAFIANILIKHTISKMHPDISGSVTSIVAGIALFMFALINGSIKLPGHLMLILLGTAISFVQTMARNRAYKYATASFVTMIVSITPVFVGFLSYPILHESLSAIELVGGTIIVGSMFFVEYFKI